MKKTVTQYILPLLCCAAAWSIVGCDQTAGSVSKAAITEALTSPTMSLTPWKADWLLEPGERQTLSPEQVRKVRAILTSLSVQEVPERYYRSDVQTYHGQDTESIFYLYAGEEQPLGGRLQPDGVSMDDFVMTKEASRALYQILLPQLRKVCPGM